MGSIQEPSEVDVLIVGSGPSGLVASAWLSELGISHRIIDQKGTRTLNGRADGFHTRTVEIWQSFGILDKLQSIGAKYGEFCLWTFDSQAPEKGIMRVERTTNIAAKDGSNVTERCMHQGFIEAALGDAVRARGGPRVERGVRPVALRIDEQEKGEYPIEVDVRYLTMEELESAVTGAHSVMDDGSIKLERGFIDAYGTDPEEIVPHLSGPEDTIETIRAKYLIGTDGAHSWVRRQLPDFRMEGDSTDACFGVMDIIPLSNWPDIMKITSILSQHGLLFIIPREYGMVRLYVQFPENYDKTLPKDHGDVSICKDIMDAARKAIAPYTLEYKYCDWWTIYRVGQRVCNHGSYLDRVFLAGDAVHTHSPKGGQGMNVSQQDTYNLAWKIAAVLKNQLPPSILSTYESERLPVARELISLDRDMATVLSMREKRDEEEVKRVYTRLENSSGTHLTYPPSHLVANDTRQQIATNLKFGMRMPDAEIWSQATGVLTSLHSLLSSNGLWRLLVFSSPTSANLLGPALQSLPRKYPSLSPHHEDFLEILLIHSGRISDVEIGDFHETFFPLDPVTGRNYNSVFGAGSAENDGDVFDKFGIEKEAMVVLRPDWTISWVGGLGDVKGLEEWFGTVISEKGEEERGRR